MEVLTLSFAPRASGALRQRLREAALCPTPDWPGLRARHWRVKAAGVQGRYLFDTRADMERFVGEPKLDPAYALLEACTGESTFATRSDHFDPVDTVDIPLFIISAPRAGSTMLFDLLAQSSNFWTIGGESEGLIEGIPPLHPANRGFDSHRLDERDASAWTVQTLRAGFTIELQDNHGHRLLDLSERERPRLVRALEKTPENSLRVAFLAAAFPSAQFIFLHRDARQNVSSILEAWHHDGFVNIPQLPGWPRARWHFLLPQGWRALREASLLDVAAFQWNEANQQALDDLEALAPERWIAVEYSELVIAPRAVVRRLCEFVGIPVDESLAAASACPLPVAATAISPPSPIKWRSNPEFQEAALDRYTLTSARLRSLGRHGAPSSTPKQIDSPARYACFVDELEQASAFAAEDLIVNETFQFQRGSTIPPALLQRTRYRDRFLPDFPLLWIEDAETGVNYPFWARRNQVHIFSQFVPNRPPPPLPDELVAQLVTAKVLVTPNEHGQCRQDVDVFVQNANQAFAQRRFCKLPGLLHLSHACAISRYYETIINGGKLELGDELSPLRHGWHNEMVSRFFHHQLAGFVSRVAGEAVRPSYTYLSAYRQCAVLKPHVDRKQCVFTLSVLIERGANSSAEPWPLWFQTHEGSVSVTQTNGDGALFRGCELPHWRDRPPPAHVSTTLIFHYVPRDFNGVID